MTTTTTKTAVEEIRELRVAGLCPALRAIVDAEVKAGNAVVEVWTDWGYVVMLGSPFRLSHSSTTDTIEYVDVNDHHYWKGEYNCRQHKQSVACRF